MQYLENVVMIKQTTHFTWNIVRPQLHLLSLTVKNSVMWNTKPILSGRCFDYNSPGPGMVELYKSVAWREVEDRQKSNLKQMVFIPSANII